MGLVSLISTAPSLLPFAPLLPSSSTYPTTRLGAIRCKLEVDHVNNNENSFRRRELFHCVGAAVGMELLASSSSFVEVANAADLIQRRQRSEFQSSIKTTLYTALKGDPELIPSILTLALNDAMTYDKATKSGGPNGSIRFSSEINRLENKGLSAALNVLVAAKEEIDSYSKGGPISYADLIQIAGEYIIGCLFWHALMHMHTLLRIKANYSAQQSQTSERRTQEFVHPVRPQLTTSGGAAKPG